MDREFIAETSNSQKLKIFFLINTILILISVSIFAVIDFFSVGQKNALDLVYKEIKNPSLLGFFFLSFIVNIFFIPIPFEPLIVLAISRTNFAILASVLIILGVLTANFINYYIGAKFSKTIFIFMSRKKVYKMRKWANSYGVYAVLLSNLIPTFPFPLVSLGLGIARYNFLRLTIFTIIGTMLKFLAIILLYNFFKVSLFK